MAGTLRHGLLSLLAFLCLTVGAAAAEHDGYIIRLEPRVDLLGEDAALPEGVEEVYGPENLYKTADRELIAQLEEAGLLAYAEPDYPVELLEISDDPGWGSEKQWDLEAIGLSYAWARGIDGQAADGTRIRIGIVDSGVYGEHEDLQNAHFVPGVNILAQEGTAERSNTVDTYGHGTFVAGIIAAEAGNGIGTAGIAPGAEIMPIKCFDDKTSTMSALIEGIYAGVNGGCRILNLSLGVSANVLKFQFLEEAIAYAAQRGVIVVAAAGNDGTTTLKYPAAFDSVIGVGFVDRSGAVASKSHRNESIFVTAPGIGLYGLGIDGTDSYTSGGGSSYATAEVTAAAALALSADPGMTPETFMALLSRTAEDRGDTGYDTSYGHGALRIDRMLAEPLGSVHTEASGAGSVAVIRAVGLNPGTLANAIRVTYDENGAQEAYLLTTLTVDENGTLKGQVELPAEGRVSLMLLDQDWCPVISRWNGLLLPPDPPDDGTPDDGATDDGTTDDGTTDDGTTDDGTTDDGTTDDGTTDDGAANDGTADDGSTDEESGGESATEPGQTL